jgi:hypothetical protein
MTLASFISSANPSVAVAGIRHSVTSVVPHVLPSVLPKTALAVSKSSAAVVNVLRAGAALTATKDYGDVAIQYFTSIRVPAALVAGSSLAALFALVDEAKVESMGEETSLERKLVLLYHVLVLSSFLLSINVIIVSTAMSNVFLLGVNNPMATSTYALLKREYDYEFALTSWSFMTSVFSFLSGVAVRGLIQFEMFTKRRKRHALLAICSVSSMVLHLMGFVNRRLPHWPNMFRMTVDVTTMFVQRSIQGGAPCELASVILMLGGVVAGISLFVVPTQYTGTAQDYKTINDEETPKKKSAIQKSQSKPAKA